MSKSKKLGKGLAALISDKKKAKNLMNKTAKEDIPNSDIDENTLKQWADAKAKEKSTSEGPDDSPEEGQISEKLEEKKKAYEEILDKYKNKKEERFKAQAEKIDEDVPVWAEQEYGSALDFEYFDRTSKGSAKDRYEEILKKHKK